MNGGSAITDKIIADAKAQCDSIISLANSQAQAILETANSQASSFEQKSMADAHVEAQLFADRRVVAGNLDGRRVVLDCKQELVDKAFDLATQKIQGFDETSYVNFISAFIEKCVEEGDEVVVGQDEKYINEQTIKNIAQKVGKNFVLSNDKHNLSGGVILRSKIVDKDLTISSIIEQYKVDLKKDVSKILFK